MQTLMSVYRNAPLLNRFLISARPLICPPKPILDVIPDNSSILDVGCGAGTLLMAVALDNRLYEGVGCDISQKSIDIACQAANKFNHKSINFSTIKNIDDIPDGPFDVVLMIDIMHHVSPQDQPKLFEECVNKIKTGGRLIYKDMARRPLWKNLFNRLHDLIIARQIIHYVPIEMIKDWAVKYNLILLEQHEYSRLFYGHELLVFQKEEL